MHAAVLLEDDLAGSDGEERVVLALADIETWSELGAALTDDDRARLRGFTAVELHSAILRIGVASVLG